MTVSTSIYANVWADIQGNIAESVRIFNYTINEYDVFVWLEKL